MHRPGRKLELVCTLCNQLLAHAQLQQMFLLEDEQNPPETNTPKKNGGGGMSRTEKYALEEKDQVVTTKCGHMFHHGCLRSHVHHALDGRGGGGTGLFCPICTKPFAMNRLWKVIIPTTKAQRERYEQFHLMKAQNAEMHQQLQGIRSKIADAEKELTKIKEDSEECLNDIQAKQKLLDSISGPTNKEMSDLTKLHMKRQEILHVVTQHNADLLKLLAEESNLSSKDNSLQAAEPDYNQNYIPQVQPSIKIDAFKQQHNLLAGSQNEVQATEKRSRKLKKKKNESTKKNRRRNRNVSESRSKSIQKSKMNDFENPSFAPVPPPPSQIVSFPSTFGTGRAPEASVVDASSSSKGPHGRRKVDTCMKWEAESMIDTTNERSCQSISETGVPPLIPLFIKKDKDKEKFAPVNNDKLQRIQMQQPPASIGDLQDSINILLARKAPMEKGGDRRRDYK